MALNTAPHRGHRLPARATAEQRAAWHATQANVCGCRQMPAGVRRTLERANKRRVRCGVAVSLDGFIAGTKGEFDWIIEPQSRARSAAKKRRMVTLDAVVPWGRSFDQMMRVRAKV